MVRDSELLHYEVANVAQEASTIARDTIYYYQTQPNLKVEESNNEDGTTTFTVYKDFSFGMSGVETQFEPAHTYTFSGETLLDFESDFAGSSYHYDPRSDLIYMETKYRGTFNDSSHRVVTEISVQEQRVTETTQIRNNFRFTVGYTPSKQESTEGFVATSMQIRLGLTVSNEDMAKVLPIGRFVPLSNLLSSCLDTERSWNLSLDSKMPELSRVAGFPKLNRKNIPPHTEVLIWLKHDNIAIDGFAHPIEKQAQDSGLTWLVLVEFGDKTSFGRILVLDIDLDKTFISKGDDLNHLQYTANIDGEPCEIDLPIQKKFTISHIQQGSETSSMVSAAIRAFYDRKYGETELH